MASSLFNLGTLNQWNHTGMILPEVEVSDSQSPAGEYRPAAWLPVVRQDTKTESWYVVMPGKVVAVDRDGRVVPAGFKLKFEVAAGSTALTYTANDYTQKVTDLTTGVAYATNGSTSYTQTQVTTALQALGKIAATETARDFISLPVGYAPYGYYQFCGGDGSNPAQFTFHNHNLQHAVAIGCDKVLQVPLVPETQATETMGDGSISSSAITFGTSQWHNATGINATTRYASQVAATDNIVAYVFGKTPVAKITTNTPFTCTGLSGKSEVTSLDMVTSSSVFYVDYDAGVMFLYESGGNAVPTGFTDGSTTITYYEYEDTDAGSATLAMALGNLHAGDFVTYDSESNYVPVTVDIGTAPSSDGGAAYSADPEYDDQTDNSIISAQLESAIAEACFRTVGQVIHVVTYPKGGLDKVKTQYTGLTSTERMPGTATAGMTDSLNLSGGANKVLYINFLAR